ncbi:MAG: LemA family protein [bacterium]|jgi:LemA protein|nr:LemA family protein [bacterium]MBK7046654.1 LemA family protein [bacterium]MBK7187284.1 LemA family protein [bacterium]MBK7770440.1 LemA family protein [bacterium]MBK9472657.1 LemA family protein [bacterium]
MSAWVFLIPPVLVVTWGVLTYNTMVRLRQMVDESWSGIDTELKRRYDLIPNLVDVVKGYAAHESSTFEAVVRARDRAAASGGTPGEQAREEQALVTSVNRLLAVVEAYPDLKASAHYLQLQHELANTEDRIQAARRFFNANVRDLNTRVAVFPSNLVAGMFGFTAAEFFEVEKSAVRAVVGVSFVD